MSGKLVRHVMSAGRDAYFPSPDVLLRQAATNRQRAQVDYVRAIRAALDSGMSYAEVARVLGVSRQSVRQLVMSRSA